MSASFLVALYFRFAHARFFGAPLASWQELVIGVGVTTAAWMATALFAAPTEEATLRAFYRATRPGGPGWERVRRLAAAAGEPLPSGIAELPAGIACMALGCVAVYSALFATGSALYGRWPPAGALGLLALRLGAGDPFDLVPLGAAHRESRGGALSGESTRRPAPCRRVGRCVSVLLAALSALAPPALMAFTAEQLWSAWPTERFVATVAPCLRHAELVVRLQELAATYPSALRLETVGASVQGRAIHLASLGRGEREVLLWSQMHGDEPSATPALLDLARFLLAHPEDDDAARILARLTLRLVPMLNPDGAEIYARRNAQGIDINRDALRLATPEGRILETLRERFEPVLGFNLHDQSRRRAVGDTGALASVALLAVSGDAAGTMTPGRQRAARAGAAVVASLSPFFPGGIARYDDEFSPRAFGDNLTSWGTPVLLIESGGVRSGGTLADLTRANFVALLTVLAGLAADDLAGQDLAPYVALPENEPEVWSDVVISGASILQAGAAAAYRADLAFDRLRPDRIVAGCAEAGAPRSRIVEIGDASLIGAQERIAASGGLLLAPFEVGVSGWGALDWLDGRGLERLGRLGIARVVWSVPKARLGRRPRPRGRDRGCWAAVVGAHREFERAAGGRSGAAACRAPIGSSRRSPRCPSRGPRARAVGQRRPEATAGAALERNRGDRAAGAPARGARFVLGARGRSRPGKRAGDGDLARGRRDRRGGAVIRRRWRLACATAAFVAGVMPVAGCHGVEAPSRPPGAASAAIEEVVRDLEPASRRWVERTLAGLDLESKVGQVVMVRAYGLPMHPESAEYRDLVGQIEELGVGGLVLFRSELDTVPVLLGELQRRAKVPLLVSADLERSLAFRVDEGTVSLPSAMAIGATGSAEGRAVRRRARRRARRARSASTGRFAPVADVNNNPDNPVINIRSFGENPELVGRTGRAPSSKGRAPRAC